MMEAHEATGPQDLLGARVTIPQTVVYRTFPHETVVLNLETGLYHGINPTGGRMLEALAELGLVKDAAQALSVEFEVPLPELQQDLSEFCTGLASRGLLVIQPS